LPANSLCQSHLAPKLREDKERLTSALNVLQLENGDLLEMVMRQRQQVEDLVAGLETIVADLDDSVNAMPHGDMLALTSETVDMD